MTDDGPRSVEYASIREHVEQGLHLLDQYGDARDRTAAANARACLAEVYDKAARGQSTARFRMNRPSDALRQGRSEP